MSLLDDLIEAAQQGKRVRIVPKPMEGTLHSVTFDTSIVGGVSDVRIFLDGSRMPMHVYTEAIEKIEVLDP